MINQDLYDIEFKYINDTYKFYPSSIKIDEYFLASDFEVFNLTKMELKIVLDRYKYELRQAQSKYIQSNNVSLELKHRKNHKQKLNSRKIAIQGEQNRMRKYQNEILEKIKEEAASGKFNNNQTPDEVLGEGLML